MAAGSNLPLEHQDSERRFWVETRQVASRSNATKAALEVVHRIRNDARAISCTAEEQAERPIARTAGAEHIIDSMGNLHRLFFCYGTMTKSGFATAKTASLSAAGG